jgi:heme/copper-type cytochrome/quinol oxidase subunit 2
MEKEWMLLTMVLIFLTFIFLYWKLTRNYGKKEYGKKMWKHWPTRLAYWEGAVLYSIGLTLTTVFILKWVNVLPF